MLMSYTMATAITRAVIYGLAFVAVEKGIKKLFKKGGNK